MAKRSRSKRPKEREAKRAQKKARFGAHTPAHTQQAEEPPADDTAQQEAQQRGVAAFEGMYRAIGLLPAEGELDELLRALRRPLPVSFRVCALPARRGEAEAALAEARGVLVEGAAPRRVGGITVTAPVRHGWAGAWQLGCDDRILRGEVRANAGGDLAKLHAWIVRHNASGVITRQEVASMLPVALLDVRPGHKVLDLCASPGSKTTQALEALCADQAPPSAHSRDAPHAAPAPAGFVAANELVPERAFVLAKRCAALGTASARLAVTCHRAQIFPAGGGLWDRIVCDVPCSGDGTFRKYRDKWGHWQAHQGRELHSLQLQIALRAAALLKVGGRMSYSTCSLNPMEDEAVVAALLARTGGALSVVKCRDALGGFQTRPGVQTWRVLDDELAEWRSYADAVRGMPKERSKRFRSTMWPPEAGSRTGPQLGECLRLYPHLNNTGGFFVCILQKLSEWPEEGAGRSGAAGGGGRRVRPPPCEANGRLVRMSEGEQDALARHLNVRREFLHLGRGAGGGGFDIVTRGEAGRRAFALGGGLLESLVGAGDDSAGGGLNVVAAGVCVAVKSAEGAWSLTLEGAEMMRGGARKKGMATVLHDSEALSSLLSLEEATPEALGLPTDVGGDSGRFIVEVCHDKTATAWLPALRRPSGLVRLDVSGAEAAALRRKISGVEQRDAGDEDAAY